MRARQLFLVFAVLALGATPVRADVSLCNTGDHDKHIAYMADVPDGLFWHMWTSVGWVSLAAGECKAFISSEDERHLLGSVLTEGEDGALMLDEFTGGDETSWPIEEAYCVPQEAPYHEERDSLESYATCGPGEYLQLFNLQIDVPDYTDLTLDLP
jgi:hypothetical protein